MQLANLEQIATLSDNDRASIRIVCDDLVVGETEKAIAIRANKYFGDRRTPAEVKCWIPKSQCQKVHSSRPGFENRYAWIIKEGFINLKRKEGYRL